jgi:hypothetical protein
MPNPWLEIPITDYEQHMSHAAVAQAQMLSRLLQEAIFEYQPRSIAILGAAGGKGLEKVDPMTVRRVVAIDVNPAFLALCTERYSRRFERYEAIVHDLSAGAPSFQPVDFIYAGLILEYVDCGAALSYLPQLVLRPGVFVVLMQLPSPTLPTVSDSPFASLRQIESTFHFVDPQVVRTSLLGQGFTRCTDKMIRLESGKEFHYAVFRLGKASSEIRQ